ncbi:hypothetical protein S245_012593, partial [Arachis hypogaea]
ERSALEERTRASSGGRSGSENVGLSNANVGENPMPRKPKGSSARVCLDLVPLSRPAPKQCFTPRCPVNCCASTHFGENQLALGSSGISPLTTTHPLILQHQLAFATAPVVSLNQATAYESPAHSSTGTRLEPRAGLLPLLGSLRFHVLFHSPMGVLFTLPSRYYFTIGHPGVFSLARWSLLIHTGFHVPHATRVRA